MRIVLKIGGSVIASPINPTLVKEYIQVITELTSRGHEVAIVVGGGKLARTMIHFARQVGLDEKDQDDIAISVSRIYAQIFQKKLGFLSCETILTHIEDAVTCLSAGKIPVMGGLQPGMTTDTVAALIADQSDCDLLIKVTDRDGIYDKDPGKFTDAVKLSSISFDELSKVLSQDEHSVGIHQVLDPEAIKILTRERIRVVVVNGFQPKNVVAAIQGKHSGTEIH
jgi:uridylate kinase